MMLFLRRAFWFILLIILYASLVYVAKEVRVFAFENYCPEALTYRHLDPEKLYLGRFNYLDWCASDWWHPIRLASHLIVGGLVGALAFLSGWIITGREFMRSRAATIMIFLIALVHMYWLSRPPMMALFPDMFQRACNHQKFAPDEMELCAVQLGPYGDVRFFYPLAYLTVFLLIIYVSARRALLLRKPANQITRRVGLVLVAPLTSVLFYAWLIEPNWVEVTYHGESPAGRPPIRIAVLSDLHFDGIGYRERVVIEQLREVRPDILVLAGDVVDEPRDLPALRTFLSQLDVPHAIAVLGNWEHWGYVPIEQLHALYREHKVELLVNAAVQFSVDGHSVRLVGLDDATARTPRLDLAIRGLEETATGLTILIQHSPGFFAAKSAGVGLPNRVFDLCLSGHTHGGQITLFGWAFGPLPPGSGPFVAGRYETAACPLYVSRGLGTSLLPMRLFARPELAVFDV